MNRSQKLEALQALLSGTPIEAVFKTINLLLVESETDTLILGAGKTTLKNDQVNDFLATIRKNKPFHLLSVTRLTQKEYEAICKEFENEY